MVPQSIVPVPTDRHDVAVSEADVMKNDAHDDGKGDDEEKHARNKLNLKEIEATLEGSIPNVEEARRPRMRRAMSMLEMQEIADIREFDGVMQAMSEECADDVLAAKRATFPILNDEKEKAAKDKSDVEEEKFFFFDGDDDDEAGVSSPEEDISDQKNDLDGQVRMDESPPLLSSMKKSKSFAALASNSMDRGTWALCAAEEDNEHADKQIDDNKVQSDEYYEPVRFEPVKDKHADAQTNDYSVPLSDEPREPIQMVKQVQPEVKKKTFGMKKSSSMASLISFGKVGLISADDTSARSQSFESLSCYNPHAVPKRSSMKSGSVQADVDAPKMQRNVSFHKLEVREYNLTIGDNAACSRGPPVQLGWTYDKESVKVIDVDEYEKSRGPRRTRNQMVMSYNVRWWRLMRESGCTVHDLKKAAENVQKTKKQRRHTVQQVIRKEKLNERLRSVESVRKKMTGLLK